jgi:hypothetical protein
MLLASAILLIIGLAAAILMKTETEKTTQTT